MTDTAVPVEAKAPTTPGKMPPAVRLPIPVVMVLMAGFRRRFWQNAAKRYGPVFAINVPFFGRSVVISDPALIRGVFLASTDDLINVQPNLSRIFGPGSVFALDGAEHRARRKLLAPPFHGQSIKNYEKVIRRDLRETATARRASSSDAEPAMNRIALGHHPAHRVQPTARTRLPARDHSK
jgi:cytochrome P450